MAKASNVLHGEICTCLPLRPIIAIVAFVSLLVGGWHLIEVMRELISLNPSEWASGNDMNAFKYPRCQLSECHEAWRDQLISCRGNRDTTFKLRYLTIGILGLFFGWIGFQGTLTRNSTMVKAFSVYLLFLA